MDNATKRHPEKRKREQPPSLPSTTMNQNKKSEATPALMQPPEAKQHKSTHEPFDSLLQGLKHFGENNPDIAAQATRLVSLYRWLWDSYAATCSDNHNLTNENRQLEQSNRQLCLEKEQLENRHAEQKTNLEHYRQGLHEVLKELADIVESLGMCSSRGSVEAPPNEKARG